MTPQSNKPQTPQHNTPIVINRDGSLNIQRPREKGKLFNDLYHYFLSISWPKFFFFVSGFFLASNLFFAAIYFWGGPDALTDIHQYNDSRRFFDCLLFSIHLLNSPFTPAEFWVHVVAIIQNYLGMLTLVIITGLLYARFARPSARVIFSDNASIQTYNNKLCFVFRVANERLNQIVEAHMSLTLTKNETSPEGETSRKLYNLKLETEYSPLFALSWTIRHFIDAESPLLGMTAEKMRDQQIVIFASLWGIDDTFSQTITARSVYRWDEIVYNKRFKDILVWKDNKMHIDLKGLHDFQ